MSARRVTLESRRTYRLTVALTAGELEAITARAESMGEPVATWIARTAALIASGTVLLRPLDNALEIDPSDAGKED